MGIAGEDKIGNPLGTGIESRVVDLAVQRAGGRPVPKDRLIGDLAARQYGVVSRTQLLAMGIGAGAIHTRLCKHYLHRLHRGVYAVGHMALVPLAREMAAVLACGQGAAVSHRSAAVVWHLLPASNDAEIDVTVLRGKGCRPVCESTDPGTSRRRMSGISAAFQSQRHGELWRTSPTPRRTASSSARPTKR